jgi:hypothetical protein
VFSTLFSWWRRRREQRWSHLRIVLYTRAGCHLCEAAWRELLRLQRVHHFSLESADIDKDPSLVALYGNLVPVVAVNGKVRFWGQVNRVLLERLLRGEASRQQGPR